MPRLRALLPALLALAVALPACGDDDDTQPPGDAGLDVPAVDRPADVTPDTAPSRCPGVPPLLNQRPACDPSATVEPLRGVRAVLISDLDIGRATEGFDFTCDGQIDNKLWPLSGLAGPPIEDSFRQGDIIIPLELFGVDPANLQNDPCLQLAFYVGKYPLDLDGDGSRVGADGDRGSPDGDCNDHEAEVEPGHAEVPDNGMDDDCDGMADETAAAGDGGVDGGGQTPSPNTDDYDGDGTSLNAGDCDDRPNDLDGTPVGRRSKPGQAEVCGDGFDNDCDGAADDGCNPYDTNDVDAVGLDPLSINAGRPRILFDNARIENGVLKAGPSLFELAMPIADFELTLRLSGANIEANIAADASGQILLTNARLGAVWDAGSLDSLRDLNIDLPGFNPDDSLLDAIFAGLIAQTNMLVLATREACFTPAGGRPIRCYLPDVDADGDGFETFLDSTPDDGIAQVDLCIDGDGTQIRDGFENRPDGTPKQCTEATVGGRPRFVDGLSATLTFAAVPVRLGNIEPEEP